MEMKEKDKADQLSNKATNVGTEVPITKGGMKQC